MCTVLLPPGVNPIAVNKYINININLPASPASAAKLLKVTVSFVMSVCLYVRPHGTTLFPMKFYVCVFFENMPRKLKFD
jgi:hypothetical protein